MITTWRITIGNAIDRSAKKWNRYALIQRARGADFCLNSPSDEMLKQKLRTYPVCVGFGLIVRTAKHRTCRRRI